MLLLTQVNNMYYILNKTLKFVPATSELAIINEEQSSIVLSKPATRLLLVLIGGVDLVHPREELLKSVWEDYGLTPSNNNLYMAISELRKSLTSLGGSEKMIVTIPRVGLKLEASIDVNDKETVITPSLKDTVKLKHKSNISIAVSLLLIVSAPLFYIHNTKPVVRIQSFEESLFLQHGTCDIFLEKNMHINNPDELKKDIIDKLNKYRINCNSVKKDVYYHFELSRLNKEKEISLGICTNPPNINKCETIKEMAW